MSESLPDDVRLRATEAQMRQALGLHGDTSPRPSPDHAPASSNASHPQRRRFVRDGEVPVTMVHHRQDDGSGGNQLEAARQALRAQTAAKEHAERLLGEAQNAIRDLQTKLAHERLAKDEAIQTARRVETERQAIQQALQISQEELAAERLARQQTEDALAGALDGRRVAEQRLSDATAGRTARRPSKPWLSRIAATETPGATSDDAARAETHVKPARRRGRPAKADSQESEIVEWWKPGWQKKFR
jgi:hypothetical protein